MIFKNALTKPCHNRRIIALVNNQLFIINLYSQKNIFYCALRKYILLPSLFSLHLNFICVIAETCGAEARIKLTGASAGATSLSSDVARGKCSIRARETHALLELREQTHAREDSRDREEPIFRQSGAIFRTVAETKRECTDKTLQRRRVRHSLLRSPSKLRSPQIYFKTNWL